MKNIMYGILAGLAILIPAFAIIYLVGYTVYSFIMFVILTIPMWVLILFGIIAVGFIGFLIYCSFYEENN